nr:hypothetical protein [Tanacetum cinerariifolium]
DDGSLPVFLEVFSIGALVDSGSFPARQLLDLQIDPTKGSSSLSSSSRHLFNNKTLPATHGPIQPWIRNLARKDDSRTSFNEPMDTPLHFSAFVMNQLKADTLTPKPLAGPTYELMKRSCKSLVELELFLEEVYKATTDQLDWNNPED